MTDKIYIHLGSLNKVVELPAHPLPQCKEVVDSLGGGTLLDGDVLVLHPCILEAGKHYTFEVFTAGVAQYQALLLRGYLTEGRRRKEPIARPPVKLDDNAETAYEKAEPLARDTSGLLSAGQWEIFQETKDAAAATGEALAKPMRDLTGPVVLETRLAGLAVAGVVPTGGPALPAPNAVYTSGGATAAAAEARAVSVKDGVCPAWTSGREYDGTCHLNHCELHDPYFNHALASGDRGKLARLLQQHAGGKWPLTLRQLPASAPTLPFVGREAMLHALGKEVSIAALAFACCLRLLLVVG
ncbi:g2755 [Coccomyxa elongata]